MILNPSKNIFLVLKITSLFWDGMEGKPSLKTIIHFFRPSTWPFSTDRKRVSSDEHKNTNNGQDCVLFTHLHFLCGAMPLISIFDGSIVYTHPQWHTFSSAQEILYHNPASL